MRSKLTLSFNCLCSRCPIGFLGSGVVRSEAPVGVDEPAPAAGVVVTAAGGAGVNDDGLASGISVDADAVDVDGVNVCAVAGAGAGAGADVDGILESVLLGGDGGGIEGDCAKQSEILSPRLRETNEFTARTMASARAAMARLSS